MKIETPNDWWSVLDKNWVHIVKILDMYLPIRDADVLSAKESRDHAKLLRYLNDAWYVAPDIHEIHKIPGWTVLCDLCSEDWVFCQK